MSLRDKMLAVMADVNSAVSEREELVELIAIALLTRKNLFFWAIPVRLRATRSTLFAAASRAQSSLNGFFPSRRTKNSYSGGSIFPA